MNAFFHVFSKITIKNDIGLILLITLISFFCICVGIYLLWYFHLWSSARKWERIDGRIIEFQENIDRYGSEAPKLKVAYRYVINGEIFVGKQIHLGWHRDRPNIDVIRAYRDIFARNGLVKVFVNSKKHEQSALNTTFDTGAVIFLLFILMTGALSISVFLNLP